MVFVVKRKQTRLVFFKSIRRQKEKNTKRMRRQKEKDTKRKNKERSLGFFFVTAGDKKNIKNYELTFIL